MVEKFLNKNIQNLDVLPKFKNFRWKPIVLLNSLWVNKFTNILTYSGKKKKSEKIIFNYFFLLKKQFLINPILIFFYILELLKPSFDFNRIKIGKKMHEIPVPIDLFRQYSLALRRFKLFFQKAKNNKKFELKLINETNFLFLKKNQSELLKFKYNNFQKAKANRAFVHYRWK